MKEQRAPQPARLARYTAQEDQAIRDTIAKGGTEKDAAEATGRPVGGIRNRALKLGVGFRDSKPVRDARILAEAGTCREVAARLGCHYSTVSKARNAKTPDGAE